MKPVERADLLDYMTYTDQRPTIRSAALAAKAQRRFAVGRYLCFLFENRETVRYQVQEMMRVERIVREKDIQHELDTYNELLGADGRLGCTLLIGIDDPALRDVKLSAWMDLNDTLYLRMADGTVARPTYDPRQVGTDRLSSVQYLHFDTGGSTPVAVGCEHPDADVAGELLLSDEQQAALRADLDDA